LLNLEIWSRLYLDRRAPDDVTDELKGMLAPGAQKQFAPQIDTD